jgi:hypothetical protein
VLNVVHFRRIRVIAPRTVKLQGPLLPAVPQLENHFHEFLGAIIALVMTEMAFRAEIPRLAVVHRGHDVPGCATSGQVIDGLEFPCEMIRLVIGRRPCRTEPDMLRRRRQDAENRDRIHARGVLVSVPDSDLLVVAKSIGNRKPVGKEDQVELSALQRASDLDIIVSGQKRDIVGRVAPQLCATGPAMRKPARFI